MWQKKTSRALINIFVSKETILRFEHKLLRQKDMSLKIALFFHFCLDCRERERDRQTETYIEVAFEKASS